MPLFILFIIMASPVFLGYSIPALVISKARCVSSSDILAAIHRHIIILRLGLFRDLSNML